MIFYWFCWSWKTCRYWGFFNHNNTVETELGSTGFFFFKSNETSLAEDCPKLRKPPFIDTFILVMYHSVSYKTILTFLSLLLSEFGLLVVQIIFWVGFFWWYFLVLFLVF